MLIKSGLMTQASGSLGGLTASHNKGGLYLRARTVPTNPNTTFQQEIRGFMSTLTSLWGNTLTALQREAWATYAAAMEIVNPLGDDRTLTGLNHYVRSNVPRLQAGLPRVDDGPTTFNLGDFTQPTAIAGDATLNNIDFAFTTTDDWAGEDDAAMLVRGSREQPPTINFFKGPYRYADKVDGDGVTPPTSPAALGSAFNLTAGNLVFVTFAVTRADGRLSAPFRGSGTNV